MMKKILVIEDDKFLRELISQKLVKEGYDVIEAVDGEKGLEKAGKENPDLVLLDLILPGMNGFEVLSRIKNEAALSQIPVIILSNLGQRDDIEKALEIGAADYLIKAHFTPEEIIDKIKATLK
jgi:DNA-binding response OmpR family regulator